MEVKLNKCNFNINGKWNPGIFTPTWVARTLFGKESQDTIDVEAIISPDMFIRLISDNVVVYPKKENLIIGINQFNDETIEKVENVAQKALENLNHTPVSSIGFNLGFIENDINSLIFDLFETKDKAHILDNDYNISASAIQHALEHDDWKFNIDLTLEETQLEVHINFHCDVGGTVEAKEKIDNKLISFKNEALEALRNIYRLSLEESEDETEEGGLENDIG